MGKRRNWAAGAQGKNRFAVTMCKHLEQSLGFSVCLLISDPKRSYPQKHQFERMFDIPDEHQLEPMT
jgi:hypothetical protein